MQIGKWRYPRFVPFFSQIGDVNLQCSFCHKSGLDKYTYRNEAKILCTKLCIDRILKSTVLFTLRLHKLNQEKSVIFIFWIQWKYINGNNLKKHLILNIIHWNSWIIIEKIMAQNMNKNWLQRKSKNKLKAQRMKVFSKTKAKTISNQLFRPFIRVSFKVHKWGFASI